MRRSVKDILRLFLQYPGRVAAGIVCLLVVDGAQLTIPLVVRKVVDGVATFSLTQAAVGRAALGILALSLTIASFRFAWRHFFFSASRLA